MTPTLSAIKSTRRATEKVRSCLDLNGASKDVVVHYASTAATLRDPRDDALDFFKGIGEGPSGSAGDRRTRTDEAADLELPLQEAIGTPRKPKPSTSMKKGGEVERRNQHGLW